MKKALFLTLVMAACTPVGKTELLFNSQSTNIKYQQDGATCNYIEEYGEYPVFTDKNYGNQEFGEFILRNKRVVSYANTNCSKIIDEDMKNNDASYTFYKSSLHSNTLTRPSVIDKDDQPKDLLEKTSAVKATVSAGI